MPGLLDARGMIAISQCVEFHETPGRDWDDASRGQVACVEYPPDLAEAAIQSVETQKGTRQKRGRECSVENLCKLANNTFW